MKKLNSILPFCLLIFALFFMVSCSTNTKQVNEAAPEKDPAEVYTVEIKQMKFVPEVITVQPGDKIVFVNRDIMAHDVTEFAKKKWSSGPLTTGQFWTLTATKSADYFCSIHQVMKGKVLVE